MIAGKCLTNHAMGTNLGFVMFADFHGLNIPTMAVFKNTELGKSADSSQESAHHWL